IASRCDKCDRLQFPADPSCPYCGAEGTSRVPVGPSARLWLYTAVTTRPAGYRGPVPYGFGIVELPEGVRIVTRLTEAALDRLQEGMSMRLVIEPLHTDDEGVPVLSYAFAPERGAQP